MRRAPTRSELVRATLVGKICFGLLLLSAGCLESGYVLQRDAQEQPSAGQSSGGADVGMLAGAGGDSGGPATPECKEAFQEGVDFRVCSARYWGEGGTDVLRAVELGPQGELWLGGQSEATGVVARVELNGAITTVTHTGTAVSDLAVTSAGVVVATDEGLLLLSANLSQVVAEFPLLGVTRVAAAEQRIAALTSDGIVVVLDEAFSQLGELVIPDKQVEDLAIDASGHIAITGFRPAASGGACVGLFPFVEVYRDTEQLLWRAYDFEDAPGWCASSAGRRVVIRGDWLYYAGEQQGGNSVHQRDPRDLAVQAPLVSYDDYSTSAGKAIDQYSFVARFALTSGALETGQVIVPRDADGIGGTLFTSALAVDEVGRIFLGGRVSCCIEARETRQISGQALGAFAGEEASLLILSPDLRQRLSWTSFTGAGAGAANVESIAVGRGIAALVASVPADSGLVVQPSDAPGPSAGAEGYFVTFPAP